MTKFTQALLAVMILAAPTHAEDFRIFIASDDDLYSGDILRFALKAQGGNHSLEVVRGAEVAQDRALRMLEYGRAPYNVIYSGYSPSREKKLAMVKFPLTRGLLGYRVLAVRHDKVGLIKPDISFDKLQTQICFGTGRDWPDTTIMRDAGLCVVTGNDGNLWPMLVRGRFDAFPRSLIEVAAEMQTETRKYPQVALILDPSVMLAYRADLFFFMSKMDVSKAAIIKEGLDKAHANGSYDRFFYSIPTIRAALREIKRQDRTTIHLGTPKENATLASIPDGYWYNYDNASAFASHMDEADHGDGH